LAALGHDRTTDEVLVGIYMFWTRLPWWIAAMRSAIGNDPGKQERARKSLRAIESSRRRRYRSDEPTTEPDDPST
jgi:hypothetical protein